MPSFRPTSLLVCLTIILAAFGTTTQAHSASKSASSSPLVHLPADQAAHAGASNEWWYVVGHLHAGKRTFGFEVTIFKFDHVRPPGLNTPITIFRTDLAITDEATKRFLHRVTYYFPQSASLSHKTLAVRVGNSSLIGSAPARMTLRGTFGASGINLQLSSRRGPMYVGGRGYLQFANGYTYYYSLTDLATTGSLRVAGKSYSVSGISWLDHQWGNWSWASVRGWTWMAWQLDNGVQLSVFDFRSSAGRVRAASVLLADGRLQTIKDPTITPLGSWRSPHTHGVYPSGWLVRISALHAVMRVQPTVRDQEMTVPGQPAGSYWEGSSRLHGTFLGKSVSGLGYTELTGYAKG